jgi:hypothetical protein
LINLELRNYVVGTYTVMDKIANVIERKMLCPNVFIWRYLQILVLTLY